MFSIRDTPNTTKTYVSYIALTMIRFAMVTFTWRKTKSMYEKKMNSCHLRERQNQY